MATLTIYTEKFDSEENIANGGMSGKVFLDLYQSMGITFNSIDEALNYLVTNNISIGMIEFNYLTEDGQLFKKFKIDQNW